MIDLDPQAHDAHVGLDGEEVDCTVYDILVDPDRSINKGSCRSTSDRRHRRDGSGRGGIGNRGTERPSGHSGRVRGRRRSIRCGDDRLPAEPRPTPRSTRRWPTRSSCATHFLALQGVGKLLETVGLVCRSVNPALEVTGVVLCMHEKQTNLAREVVDDLDTFFTESRDSNVPWSTAGSCSRRSVATSNWRKRRVSGRPFSSTTWLPGATRRTRR